MLPRIHTLIVGPGLGRNNYVMHTVARIVAEARNCNISLVIEILLRLIIFSLSFCVCVFVSGVRYGASCVQQQPQLEQLLRNNDSINIDNQACDRRRRVMDVGTELNTHSKLQAVRLFC